MNPKGECDNCKRKMGIFIIRDTLAYYQCKECKGRFCHGCKAHGPSCPRCSSRKFTKIGLLGQDY